MTDIHIHRMEEPDIEETAYVMRKAFASVHQEWDEKQSNTYMRGHLSNQSAFIAKEKDMVVGFLIADKKSDNLFIDAIGVLPSKMGKGIAKLLWEKAVEFCRQQHIEEVKMIADPKSQAYQWYKRLGFDETGWVEMSLDLKM